MPFTSSIFQDPTLPRPLPVVDIFASPIWTYAAVLRIGLKVEYRLLWASPLLWPVLIIVNKYINGQFFEMSLLVCLRKNAQYVTLLWWMLYFMFGDLRDFETDYVEAWAQRGHPCISIFVDQYHILVPLPPGADDSKTLEMVYKYYVYTSYTRGLAFLFGMKQLERVDRVQVFDGQPARLLETIAFGRAARRLLKAPQQRAGQEDITQQLINNLDTQAIELGVYWNSQAVSIILLLPIASSLVFAGVWIGIYVNKGADVQAVVQTAFTVSGYIVTAGALLLGLIAYLEQARQGDR